MGLLSLILTIRAAKGSNWSLNSIKEEISVMIVPITLTYSLKYDIYLVCTSKVVYTLWFGILLEYVGVLGYNYHIYD